MTAGLELTSRLETVFSNIPYERKTIDLMRALRWGVDADKEARLTCVTKPIRIEADGRVADEMRYPRLYSVELAFVRDDDMSMTCLAKSNWFVDGPGEVLNSRGWSLRQHDTGLGIDPFDIADMGDPAHDPGRDIVMFFNGFIEPDILKVEGVNDLLNTRVRGN